MIKINTLTKLCLGAVFALTFGQSANAQVISLEMFTLIDGTGPFSAADSPGDDASALNGITRTHDEITYRTIFKTSGGDTNVVGTFVLPTIDAGPTAGDPAATWREVPPQCIGVSSEISVDGLTLTCDLGDLPNATTQSVEPVAVVSGKSPNGQEIDFAGAGDGKGLSSATSDQSAVINAVYFDTIAGPNQGPVAANGVLHQLVSAAPRFDLMLGNNLAHREGSYGSQAHAFNGQAGPAGEAGLSLTYGVFMFAHEIKGSEMLDPNGSFDYSVALTPSANNPIPQASLDAAKLVAWSGPKGNQQQNLNPGCKNGALNNFYMPYDRGPVDYSGVVGAVTNGGQISCVQATAGDDIEATISGIESSLNHFPSYVRTGGGTNPIDNNEWYVMSKIVSQFIPTSALPAVGGLFYLDACVTMNAAPVSISGQVNIDPNPFVDKADNGGVSNHCKTNGFRRTQGGYFYKTYGKGSVDGAPAATQDPRIIGDDRVNFVSPGQQYRSRVYTTNSGSEPIDYRLCEKIDNSRQKVITGYADSDLARVSNRSVTPGALVEWGVQVGDGTGTITDSWGEYPNANLLSLGGNEYSGSTTSGSGTLYEDSHCPDADSSGNTAGAPTAYFTNHADILAAGYSLDQITMVRFTGSLLGGDRHFQWVQLELRPTFKYAAKDVFLKPVGPVLNYNAGAVIPSGSHVPNYVSGILYDPDTGLEISRTRLRVDVVQVQSVRNLRIKKTAVPSSGLQVAPGQTINYKITPNYTTPDLGTPADVTLTDILPVGLTYLATSNGSAPTVELDTPAAGMTKLTWILQNQVPVTATIASAAGNLSPIEYTARVNTNTLSGTQFVNWTTLSDGGLDSENEPDCAFDLGTFPADPAIGYGGCTTSFSTTPVKADDTVHIMSAPPGFSLFKEVLDPIIYPDAEFTHQINWAPIGGATSGIRVIDVFPWNGDARGSVFNGTLSLVSVVPQGDLLADNPTIYYTAETPANIHQDPFVASNALDVGGIWCDTGDDPITPDIGTGSCPATIAESTAVLIDQATQLDANSTYSAKITFATTGNQETDVYGNNHSVNDSGSDLDLLLGNTVISTVYEASVGDRVWHDYNADGVEDAVEPGIENVTVTLTGVDVIGVAVNISTTTNSTGYYLFNRNNGLLRPSNSDGYTITVTQPTGYVPTYDLDDGAFYFTSASASASAAPEITVAVEAQVDLFVPANQTVKLNLEEKQESEKPVKEAKGAADPNDAPVANAAPLDTLNSSGSFVLTATDDKRDVDFAYTQFGEVRVDKDVIGGDSLDAWVFSLSSEVAGCVIPATITNPAATPTGADGSALFPNLSLFSSTSGDACTYSVTEMQQTGYVLNTALSGADTGLAPTPDQRQAIVNIVNQKLGTITGKVSEDIDGSGAAALLPLFEVTLTLLNADGTPFDFDPMTAGLQEYIVLTDINGGYRFINLPLGEYLVRQTDLATYSSMNDVDSSDDLDTTENTDTNNHEIPVTITVGEVDADNDFVDERRATISGNVSEDIDGAGNLALVPIENVMVRLLNVDGTVYDSDTTTAGVQGLTAQTDQNGNYSISGIPLGEYIIEELDLPSYRSLHDEDSSDDTDATANTNNNDNRIPVTLTPAEVDADNNYIDEQPGTITGNVFEDTDGLNGNAALVPVAGVILSLLNADGSDYDSDENTAGTQPYTVLTDANGGYTFSNISPGEYLVKETDSTNYTSVSDEDKTDDGDTTANDNLNDNEIPVTVTAAEVDANNDFVDQQRGSISGFVYEDIDGLGNAELAPLENILITLLNADATVYDSDPDTNGVQELTATTNQNGSYLFENISLGEYIVEQTDAVNYRSINDDDSSDDADTSNNDNTNDNRIPITLTPAEFDADNIFIDEQPGSIAGNVAEDTDGSGTASLVNLENVTLTLLNADGTEFDSDTSTEGVQLLTALTDNSGNYNFADLRPGEYLIKETDLERYGSVKDEDSSDDADTSMNSDTNDNQIPVTIRAGEADINNNFIDELVASISGNVSVDTDGNDVGDEPLAGVMLNLLDVTGNPILDDNNQPITTITDENGVYIFTGLPSGSYQILQTQVNGYASISDSEGDLLDDLIANITLNPGDAILDRNFIKRQTSQAIPTLSEWSLMLLILMLGFIGYRATQPRAVDVMQA